MGINLYFGKYYDSSSMSNPFTDIRAAANPSPQLKAFVLPEKSISLFGNVKKINGIQKTQKMYPASGAMAAPVTNPISGVKPQTFGQTIESLNKNPFLSFVRGERAQNMPLNEDAITVKNGVAGGCLNIIG